MKMILIIMQMKNIWKKKKEELNIKKIKLNYFLGMDFGAINIYF